MADLSMGAHRGTRAADPHVYRIQDLSKTYGSGPTAVHALRGLRADIDEGHVIVLLGPSGSGESTLLNILGGLDLATGGHAWFYDLDLTACDDDELTRYRRQSVGFVLQFHNLIASLTSLLAFASAATAASGPLSIRRWSREIARRLDAGDGRVDDLA